MVTATGKKALEAMGWYLEHTGGGIYNAYRDFVTPGGEVVGVSIGTDCAVAYRLPGGRFLRAGELAEYRELGEAEEVLLLTPSGPTPEGLSLLGNNLLREVEDALALLD